MTPVRLKPAAPRSRVKHSTTEPLRSLNIGCYKNAKIGTLQILERPFQENGTGRFAKARGVS